MFEAVKTAVILSTIVALVLVSACSEPRDNYRSSLQGEPDPEALRAEQLETAERVAAIGMAVEAYIRDYPEIGAPKTATVDGLLQAFRGCDISTEGLQTADAWGNELLYEQWYSTHPQNRSEYAVISLGRDGVRDRWLVTEHVRDFRPGQDIIWRYIPEVLLSAGFTHGPTAIRSEYPNLIAEDADNPTLRYDYEVEDLLQQPQ